MATHSSTLAWKIPWMEEPGRLQSMGSQRVGHDWATSLSFFTFLHWRRKWQPTPVFLPGESQGWGSLRAAIYGVTQSRTRLKWLSRSIQNSLVHYRYHAGHYIPGLTHNLNSVPLDLLRPFTHTPPKSGIRRLSHICMYGFNFFKKDSTCKWNHTAFEFICLTYFT